jgi:N4-gp56 family major capsid protein
MALSSYGVNANEAVKIWSKRLFIEVLKYSNFSDYMGTSTDDLLVVQEEISKGAGDRVRVILRRLLTGAGTQGDTTLEGNEEPLSTYVQDLLVDQLRHAVRSGGQMSEQRIPFDIRKHAVDALADWWTDRLDFCIANQLCGNTGQTDTRYTGNNATTAPTTATGNNRIVFPDATNSTEALVSSNKATLQITHLDRALSAAKTATPFMRPLRTGAGSVYVYFMHPNTSRDLQTNATQGQVTWYDLHRRLDPGKILKVAGNGDIFSRALGTYKNCVMVENIRIPLAPSTTDVYRNVLCGAQAGIVAFGQRYSNRRMSWKEKLFDFDNQLAVKAGLIFGVIKSVFNGIDYGTVVTPVQATQL